MNQQLVDELRKMFIEGASPSQLMHRIAEQYQEDPRLHLVIGDYFREAFGIPLLRYVVPDEDYCPAAHHAHYNRNVVPEIIQRINEWNTTNLDGSWLDGLSVCDVKEHENRLQSYQPEELARIWESLTEQEKVYIRRQFVRLDHRWEVMKSLAALAERLQQQVVELQAQLHQQQAAQNGKPEAKSPPRRERKRKTKI